jgi:c-di-GMP-binding flagellar brake protein YcgR
VKKEESGNGVPYGTVNFERRKHPRFNVDLPIEYSPAGIFVKHGRAVNASEGGLLLYLQEKMEIGRQLVLKLFFPPGSEMSPIRTLVQMVWVDTHLGEGQEDYRTGVKFVDISPVDLDTLKIFLRSLSSP